MNFKSVLAVVALLAVTHYGAYWYGSQKPAEVRVVEKEVVRKDIITKIVEIVKPDGTKETVTIIVDKSTEDKSKKIDVMPQRPKDWLVGAYYKVTDPAYGISASRRVLGPIFVQVSVDTSRNLNVGAAIEF